MKSVAFAAVLALVGGQVAAQSLDTGGAQISGWWKYNQNYDWSHSTTKSSQNGPTSNADQLLLGIILLGLLWALLNSDRTGYPV